MENKILLISEDLYFYQFLENILLKNDCELIKADTTNDAYAILDGCSFDLIIGDFDPQSKEGENFLKYIHDNSLPVILLNENSTNIRNVGILLCKKDFNEDYLLNNIFYVLNNSKNNNPSQKDMSFQIVYHDLLSPLAALKQTTRILSNNLSSTNTEDLSLFLQDIHTTINALHDYTKSALDLNKAKIFNTEIVDEKIGLSKVVKQIIEIQQFNSAQKNIKVISQIGDEIEVSCNKTLLIRCINNIISNAIKFSYPDSTIDIKAIKRDNNIEIQVSDTGTGIKKDELEKIFSGSVSKKGTFGETGRGIGLRMIKEDIENNNGEIKIESTEGKGTTVFIILPA